jgi:membrane-bound serine protease (ClpP class)
MLTMRWLALALLSAHLILAGLLLAPTVPAQAQSPADEVVVLSVDGAITPVVAGYIDRGLSEAERDGARAVVIVMDTPGGLDTAMRAIIQRILASEVPVITYVSPGGARAASAGTFISYAAHVAAMAPSTTIGSASPVSLGQDGQAQETSDTMEAKVTNDAVSYIRGLAERRGRNADWAERAVREAANLTASQALEMNVIDVLASDLGDLLRQVDGREVDLASGRVTLQTAEASVRRLDPHLGEAFLQLIANPTLAYLLLSLGLLGLYLELSNPGSILPGVAGTILLITALFALGSLPVNWAGVLLIVLAFILFAADVWTTSHGVLTVGGLIAFILGSLMLLNTNAGPFFQIVPGVMAAVIISLSAFTLIISALAVGTLRRRPATGIESLIGATAVARTRLDPDGTVFLEGERWRAHSQSGPVERGQRVRVQAIKGLDLVVTVADDTSVTSGREQSA